MNKSHITSDQVKSVLQMYWHADDPSKIFSQVDLQDMHRALEAAFPETSIQELLRDEERSARHDPAAFGPLVVTEDDAEEINYAKDIREALQSFVDRHSIKPIAFVDKTPTIERCERSVRIFVYDPLLGHWSTCDWAKGSLPRGLTHWIPASALPIPEPPAVDAMEAAWREYCSGWRSVGVKANRLDFLAGYEAGQAGGKK